MISIIPNLPSTDLRKNLRFLNKSEFLCFQNHQNLIKSDKSEYDTKKKYYIRRINLKIRIQYLF